MRALTHIVPAMALAVALAACGPTTRSLEDGSRSPAGPRTDRSANFEPRIGDFASIESFEIVPARMSEAASTMVTVVLPRVRERGGLRDVWILRNDAASRLEIVSIWAEPVQFQQWQMSQDRIDAYQALGPVLTAQPSAAAVAVIGLINARSR